MKKIAIIIFLLVSLKTVAQDKRPIKRGCDFLENLHYKNGVDTIIVKAYYHSYYKLASLPVMEQLQSARKLKITDFKYAVSFIPINCSKEYGNPCRYGGNKIPSTLDRQTIGKVVYVTCIVYEGYHNFPDEMFYIIDKVSIENPD